MTSSLIQSLISLDLEDGVPAYVTDAEQLRSNAQEMLRAFEGLPMKIFYALKANHNPALVKILKDEGVYGIDAVSINEIKMALSIGYTSDQIIFTPSNPTTAEIRKVAEMGVFQNLGSLSELRRFTKVCPGGSVSIRICPEVGAGESSKVNTGETSSKFGIGLSEMATARTICAAAGVKIIGIHSHIGSGFYTPDEFSQSVDAVCKIAEQFPDVSILDFGGGFGVRYFESQTPVELDKFAEAIQQRVHKFTEMTGRDIELRIEPGKFLVANTTVLLAEVTTIKEKGGKTFVGLGAGFNNLIRPAMYDAYHHVINLTKDRGEFKEVSVVGNVCETCDVFNPSVELQDPQEGDLVAIMVVGAYGSAMSSTYNLRPLIAEYMIDGGEVILIRKPQTFEDIMLSYKV